MNATTGLNRTPTPWIVNCCTRRSTGLYRWQIATEEGRDAEVIATVPVQLLIGPGDPVAEANADFIVLAVNNHERLVKAIRNMLPVAADGLEAQEEEEQADRYELRIEAAKALLRELGEPIGPAE